MSDLKAAFDAEVAEAEDRQCVAEIRGATRYDQAEYCEDDATVQDANGDWYCAVHDPARWGEIDPDMDRDEGRDIQEDYWLDDLGD